MKSDPWKNGTTAPFLKSLVGGQDGGGVFITPSYPDGAALPEYTLPTSDCDLPAACVSMRSAGIPPRKAQRGSAGPLELCASLQWHDRLTSASNNCGAQQVYYALLGPGGIVTLTAEETTNRLEITDKIYRYCRAVDRLDVPLGHTVFHAESRAIFPNFEGSGHDWIDSVCKAHLKFLSHSHQVTNIIIEVSGDRAGSESYVTAILRSREDDKITQREYWGRYIDQWSRRKGEWRIDRRECFIDFDSTREVTPIFEDDRARRDVSDPSYIAIPKAS
jgi:hypothetical protein